MRKSIFVAGCLLWGASIFGQIVGQKLQKAFAQFETDPQLKHAISSLYVIDAKTGKVVFDKNSQVGLAPASTQKIITAVTAFELLGKEYRYKTDFGYTGRVEDDGIKGSVFITASGDPTFGSWRWDSTSMYYILNRVANSFRQRRIKNILGSFIYESGKWSTNDIPDGWIWQDVGNYYGAGVSGLNWNENQFDLFLRSGKNVGDSVKIVDVYPELNNSLLTSELKSAAKGSGDNAYIYLPKGWPDVLKVKGTIPVNEQRFKISGTMLFPYQVFFSSLDKKLDSIGISIYSGTYVGKSYKEIERLKRDSNFNILFSHYSPYLDSIIYWFLQKSINLYGEALVKTFAYEKKGFGNTDSGVVIVRNFWKQKGIGEDELNLYDGSGLSPLNRVTTHAQVEILKYAKTRDWFSYFFNSLPEYNGMKMKSGTISDVKGFCGYHKAKDGKEYIFSFLVNNYNGPSSVVVGKMYKVLDQLK
ncbi:MAG: D-alanyl-D-alanine carboxypeptidase/D-alanyl-D-alanine-endopeptidase [Chitinophagaceae bacterium]|nr:D-alanyl-D-alanine carboxypeptidase/D-alanyl-D-alanine-endopeptidase [Chitinophagaceae bacterium]